MQLERTAWGKNMSNMNVAAPYQLQLCASTLLVQRQQSRGRAGRHCRVHLRGITGLTGVEGDRNVKTYSQRHLNQIPYRTALASFLLSHDLRADLLKAINTLLLVLGLPDQSPYTIQAPSISDHKYTDPTVPTSHCATHKPGCSTFTAAAMRSHLSSVLGTVLC